MGECAGTVKGNSVTSSLVQNYSDAIVKFRKINLLQKIEPICILTAHKFLKEK